MNDEERLDWLEFVAKGPEGLLLHAITGGTGRLGLSIQDRTLRQAIDQAAEFDAAYNAARVASAGCGATPEATP